MTLNGARVGVTIANVINILLAHDGPVTSITIFGMLRLACRGLLHARRRWKLFTSAQHILNILERNSLWETYTNTFGELYCAEYRQSIWVPIPLRGSATGRGTGQNSWHRHPSAEPIPQWPRQAERWARPADASNYVRLVMWARAFFINRVLKNYFCLVTPFYI